MSANPAPVAQPWTQSTAIRALAGTVILTALAWLTGVLTAAGPTAPIVWTWRALVLAELGPVGVFVAQFFRADVQGPAALSFIPGINARVKP